ncbi:MAG: STAS domain-containing protein [Anaerolineae bacterium]|nr:STAS domain-containing protein [Chloroflexota bacterium]MBP6297905.1 STAS domain-containing protein [Anaerolineae bacterium]
MLWNVERYNNITVLSLKGALNGSSVAAMQDQILAQIQSGQRVLLDLESVQYLSSAALRFLLSLYRAIREKSGTMALAGLSEEIADIMSMTGFLDLFRTYKDRGTALALM